MKFPSVNIVVASNTEMLVPVLEQLAKRGYPLRDGMTVDGLIRTFQSQSGLQGRPLKPDGIVGAATSGALFQAVPTHVPAKGLPALALVKALSQIGVIESLAGSNDGTEVAGYLEPVGLPPGYFWCMAFVKRQRMSAS